MDKIRLVIPDELKPKELPRLTDLKFSTNGKKPRKRNGNNLYRKQMGRIRRSFRW